MTSKFPKCPPALILGPAKTYFTLKSYGGWMSTQEIADAAGTDRTAIRRHLLALQTEGILSIYRSIRERGPPLTFYRLKPLEEETPDPNL
jgi:predicted ArsR family transcriptional regulator